MKKLAVFLCLIGIHFLALSQTTISGTPTICGNGTATLTITGFNGNPNFQWEYSSDGGLTWTPIAGATSVSHQAANAGMYQCILAQGNGNNPTTVGPITVNSYPNPIASFTFSPNNSCSNTPVAFTNTSTGSGLTYSWIFGDPNSGTTNNSSTAINPVHEFIGAVGNSTQNFTVSLTATDANGCTSIVTQTVTTKQLPSTKLTGESPFTINGQNYFRRCLSGATAVFTFSNASTTTSTNTDYRIIWGDNTPDYVSTTFTGLVSHTYTVGTHTLQFIVSGQNGCSDTATYYIFLGSNPAVGLENPGSTDICTGETLTFPITGTSLNPPGTTYQVKFNDPNSLQNFNHPPPTDVSHTFTSSSCGTSSTNNGITFNNSFGASITATNPCGTSAAAVVPIYVSEKPVATFNISPKDTICVNSTATITNTSGNLIYVDGGDCTNGKLLWSITPATGWTITSGTFGNDNGTTNSQFWNSGSNTLNINFNQVGTYTIKLTTGNPKCGNTSTTRTICVTPVPTGSFTLSNNTGCEGLVVNATSTTNTPNCGTNRFLWNVTYQPTTGCSPSTTGYVFINNTDATSQNPSFQFNNPGIYSIGLIIYNPSSTCSTLLASQVVTVKGKPVVNLSAPASICQNQSISPTQTSTCYITGTSTYNWSFPGGTPASSTNANPGSILYNTPGTYTISLTVTNECGTTTREQNIIVKPVPDLTVPGNLVVCRGTVVSGLTSSSTLAGTSFSWTSSNTAIGLTGTGSGATIPNFTAANLTNGPIQSTVNITATNTGCSTSQSFTITVLPNPTVSAVTNKTFCAGATSPAISFSGTATSFNWSNSNDAIGLPASGSGNIPSFTALNTSNAPIQATITVTPVYQNGAVTCTGTPITFTITVNPEPVVNQPADLTVCNGVSVPVTAFGGTATTYNWTNNNTSIGLGAGSSGNLPVFIATNPTANPVTATITVVPVYLNNSVSCTGPPKTFTITVNPAPIVNQPANQIICANSNTAAINFTGSGSSYSWTNSNTNIGLAASGSGDIPSFSAINTGTSPIVSTITVTPNTSGGTTCNGSAKTFTITVNPVPSVTQPSDYVFCNGVAISGISFTGTASSFNWTNNNPGIGLGPNGSAAISAFTPVNTGSAPITATITVTPVFTTGNVSCTGTPKTFSITVNPSPSVAQPSNQTLCSGGNTQTISFTGTGSSYSWTNNTTSIGLAASGDGDIPSFLAVNGGTTPVTATIVVTPKTNDGALCNGATKTFTITVNPIPFVNNSNPQVVCNGASTSAITFSGSPNASFSWTNDNPSIGLAASGTGNIASFTATNSTSTQQTASITVTPLFTNNGVTCTGSTKTFTIKVNPAPSVDQPADQVLCAGNTTAAIAFTGTGTSYTWINNNTTIGLAASGTGNINAFTATNNTASPITATISVTPKTNNGAACDGTAKTFTITVNPKPVIPNRNITICSGAAFNYTPTTGNPVGTVVSTGTTYTWTTPVSNPAGAITGGSDQSTPQSSISQTLTNTTISPATLTYTVTPVSGAAGNCEGASFNIVVTVNPQPALSDTAAVICSGTAFSITPAGAPAGTTYTWSNPTISPAGAISGASAQTTPQTIISQTLVNNTNLPATAVYAVSPTSTGSCGGAAFNITVTLNPKPVIPTQTATICTGNAFLVSPVNSLPGTIVPASTTYTWSVSVSTPAGVVTGGTAENIASNNISQNLFNNTTAPAILRYLVTPVSGAGGSCAGSNFFVDVTVNPNAKAVFNPTVTIGCPPFTITPGITGLQAFPNANGTYNWFANSNPIGTGTVFPGYTIVNEDDSVTISLQTTSLYGCLGDSTSRKFFTYKLPYPSFDLSDTVGCGPLTVMFQNTTPNISLFTYSWDFGNGQTSNLSQPGSRTFAPNPSFGDTTYIVKLKVFSVCDTVTYSRSIRVKSKPKALFTPTKTTGCSPMKVTFKNTSKGLNNTYYWNFGDGSTLTTYNLDSVQHTFITGVVDTFVVKLIAVNECGQDSTSYNIIVSPNTIALNFAINGIQVNGCTPHTVAFINNSSGASNFQWNFGDGNILNTTKNIDTVYHTYFTAGNFNVSLQGLNNCSDTSTTLQVNVFPKPNANFIANKYVICIGDSVKFTNQSDSATSYLWKFGDGNTSTLVNPSHIYSSPGIYNVKLIIYRSNPPGDVCVDSIQKQIQVVSTTAGWFTMSDSISSCPPFTVTFTNQNRPSVTTLWNFGNGNTATGDSVTHTFLTAGTFNVILTVTVPGGCTYVTTRPVTVLGPYGTLQYAGNYSCGGPVQFQVIATSTNNITYNFGDGNSLTTNQPVVFHQYSFPGIYLPSVVLQNNAGCSFAIPGQDSIKVDRIISGFTYSKQNNCGNTKFSFVDTSTAYWGKALTKWNFGDGNQATGFAVSHSYTSSGVYTVQMIVVGNSGCADTVNKQINVVVYNNPTPVISAPASACAGSPLNFSANVQSNDPVTTLQWIFSNGVNSNSSNFSYTFSTPGLYTIHLIAGTINGCFDTATHQLEIYPKPNVIASPSMTLCRGSSAQLNATGATTWQWTPLQGLSCYTCPSPIASPLQTVPYIVEGKNQFGCADQDTVVITVIQPFTMSVSPDKKICIGSSTALLASGATNYQWSPSAGLSNTNVSNPIASPTTTTTYRVVGYDGFNCFTDTAFVTVGVGQYPVVNLGPDLLLSSGTLHPLTSTIQHGLIVQWQWSPSTDLSCTNCPLPTAYIRKDISYQVKVTNDYGCAGSDTVNIKVFCESSQVFIPNAFTPDGDGINDILMVRGKGIAMVKSFRIFNRWGQVVFEKSSFAPNDPSFGWNGKINGIVPGPDVFVYTAEVICDNGNSFIYKGNVSLLK
jgi:large repetitive protein